METKEKYELVGGNKLREVVKNNPEYRYFVRSGFAYKGALEEEDDKQIKNEYIYQEHRKRDTTFEERVERFIFWAAAIDIVVDHEAKEIHVNGFSMNDME